MSPRPRLLLRFSVLGLAYLGALGSCTSTKSATGPGGGVGGGGTGSLAVSITSPAGVTPWVTISGPSGYSKTLSGTQTLTGLAPGSYMIAAIAGMGPDSIVGIPYKATVTGSPANVTTSDTADASVSYAQRASEGLLWIASPSVVAGYTSSQLETTGTPSPSVVMNTPKSFEVAVDASGGAWVCSTAGDTLYYYTQAQLLGGGTPTPTVAIGPNNGSTHLASGLAFDAAGTLWVTSRVNNTLAGFTAAQLAASGSPAPAILIKSAFGSLANPHGLAFDAKGNLWIANTDNASVVGLAPAQLTASGAPVPSLGVTQTTGLTDAQGVAFDSAGNLWVSAFDTISEFKASDLTSVSSAAPVVMLTLTNSAVSGLAFDASGDLWGVDLPASKLYRYARPQLASGGALTPATVLSSIGTGLGTPGGLAFSPHSVHLPLH